MICPKCKGSEFTGPVKSGDGGKDWHNFMWYDHYLCVPCNIVLWESKEEPFTELGYCGNPIQHWMEPKDRAPREDINV